MKEPRITGLFDWETGACGAPLYLAPTFGASPTAYRLEPLPCRMPFMNRMMKQSGRKLTFRLITKGTLLFGLLKGF